jgi:hypothetical protein
MNEVVELNVNKPCKQSLGMMECKGEERWAASGMTCMSDSAK